MLCFCEYWLCSLLLRLGDFVLVSSQLLLVLSVSCVAFFIASVCVGVAVPPIYGTLYCSFDLLRLSCAGSLNNICCFKKVI